LAIEAVQKGASDASTLELATVGKDEAHRVGELLESLASLNGPADDGSSIEKWLYLVLAWLFEHRAEFEEPLSQVEVVYSDFDYPASIEGFVRYIPLRTPSTSTSAQ